MKRWITKFWGKRCPDFEKDCGCCKAWKAYDYLFQFSEMETG